MIPEVRVFPALCSYEKIYALMQNYTASRTPDSPDQIWLLEHYPVFTQGQAGKAEHLLTPGDIPVIQSDRGGQVTYHGPGQLIIYTLCDLKRFNGGLKFFIDGLHQTIIQLLARYHLNAHIQPGAPGIYIESAKIASIGLRVRKGCTYHGISLNVNMDLSPFLRINPCGFSNLRMTQIAEYIPNIDCQTVSNDLLPLLKGLWSAI